MVKLQSAVFSSERWTVASWLCELWHRYAVGVTGMGEGRLQSPKNGRGWEEQNYWYLRMKRGGRGKRKFNEEDRRLSDTLHSKGVSGGKPLNSPGLQNLSC